MNKRKTAKSKGFIMVHIKKIVGKLFGKSTESSADYVPTYGNMQGMWSYLKDVLTLTTGYKSGRFGQCENETYLYDCVCLIKSYAWCNGKAGTPPEYEANNIADKWIGYIYDNSGARGPMETLPPKGIYAVYLNNEHIGIYNADTQTVIECCGGATNKVVERPINYYDGTEFQWNKWSDIYWCPQE